MSSPSAPDSIRAYGESQTGAVPAAARMPRVSVIIPTYDHGEFVVETLKSVFAQTFKEYEVIVVNDGSSDNTADLIKPYVDKGRLLYIEQENTGVAAARNTGLSKAQGDYIAFLDDDDVWPPDKLEWQVAVLDSTRTIGVVAGGVVTLGYAPIIQPRSNGLRRITFREMFSGNPFISPGQCLIRAEVLDSSGGFDTSIWGADDYDLWLRISLRTGIEIHDRISLHYRRHARNASRDMHRMWVSSRRVIEKNLWFAPPRERRMLRHNAYRMLYDYCGRWMVRRLKTEITNRDLAASVRSAMPLSEFSRAFAEDPRLILRFLRDLAPDRVAGIAQSVRHGLAISMKWFIRLTLR